MFTKGFDEYVCVGDHITCEVDGFTVTATIHHDPDTKPWHHDGHGPVTKWVSRAKRPGERILASDHTSHHRYYDFSAAVAIARRDGWDAEPYGQGTPGQRAERAAEADYRSLKAWCDDEWFFCGVALQVSRNGIRLTDKYAASLWGIDCNHPNGNNAYLTDVANDLLDEALDEARRSLAALCDCHK